MGLQPTSAVGVSASLRRMRLKPGTFGGRHADQGRERSPFDTATRATAGGRRTCGTPLAFARR